MAADPHQQRFMAYLSMFTFFMLVLIAGNNYIVLFFFFLGQAICEKRLKPDEIPVQDRTRKKKVVEVNE